MSTLTSFYRDGPSPDDADSPRKITRYLAHLKENGSNLLVTGDVAPQVTGLASQRLLGDPTYNRKRISVFTDAQPGYVEYCLPGCLTADHPDVWVINQGRDDRSLPASATSVDVNPSTSLSELTELREELVEAISFFATDARNGLDPAQLRLSFNSLELLVTEHDRTELERFLRTITALITGNRGMAHFHLPVSDNADVVQALSSLFDARIELRHHERQRPEQRWHVPAKDLTTVWTTL